MIRYRLINCDFLNASTFTNSLGNKAKLIYLMMITNADDLGFVGNMDQIIKTLVRCDDGYEQAKVMGLQDTLETEYINAKIELVTKTYIYVFTDKHNNEIFVIKHWFKHNRYIRGLRTNYDTFYSRLELENGEYFIKNEEETLKEDKDKINESKVNKPKKEKMSNEEWDKLMKEVDELNEEYENPDEDDKDIIP